MAKNRPARHMSMMEECVFGIEGLGAYLKSRGVGAEHKIEEILAEIKRAVNEGLRNDCTMQEIRETVDAMEL